MNNENENITNQSITAIAKSSNKFKAAEVSKHGGVIEVTKTKTSKENAVSWRDFAVECGLSIEPVTEEVSCEHSCCR